MAQENTPNNKILKRKPPFGLLDQFLETAPKKTKDPNPIDEIHSTNQSDSTPEPSNELSTSLTKVSMAARYILVSALKASRARLLTTSIFEPNPQIKSKSKATHLMKPSTSHTNLPNTQTILPVLQDSTATILTLSSFLSSYQAPSVLPSTFLYTSSDSSNQPSTSSSQLLTGTTTADEKLLVATYREIVSIRGTYFHVEHAVESLKNKTSMSKKEIQEWFIARKYESPYFSTKTIEYLEKYCADLNIYAPFLTWEDFKKISEETKENKHLIKKWFTDRIAHEREMEKILNEEPVIPKRPPVRSPSFEEPLERYRAQIGLLREFYRKKYGNDELYLSNQDLHNLIINEEMRREEIRNWFIMRNCSQSFLGTLRHQTELLKEFHRKKYGNDELKLNNEDLKYLVRCEKITREELQEWFEIVMEIKEDPSVLLPAKNPNEHHKKVRKFSSFRRYPRLVAYLENVYKKNNHIGDNGIKKLSEKFSVQPWLIKHWFVERQFADEYQNSLRLHRFEAVAQYEQDRSFWKRCPGKLQFELLRAVRTEPVGMERVTKQNKKCGMTVSQEHLSEFVERERIREKIHHTLFVRSKIQLIPKNEMTILVEVFQEHKNSLEEFINETLDLHISTEVIQTVYAIMRQNERNCKANTSAEQRDQPMKIYVGDQPEDRVENYGGVATGENHYGPSEEYDDITIIDIAPENRTNFLVHPEIEQVEEAQMEENNTPGSSNNDDDDLIEIAYYSAQNPRIERADNVDGKITEEHKRKLKKIFTKYGRYASNFIKEADLLNLSKEERDKLVDEFDNNKSSERPSKLMSARIQNSLATSEPMDEWASRFLIHFANEYRNSLEVCLTEAVAHYEKEYSFWKQIPDELQLDLLQAVRRNITVKKVIEQNRKCGFPVPNIRLEEFIRIERIKEKAHQALFVSGKQSEKSMEIDADDGEAEQLNGFSQNDDECQREEPIAYEMMKMETNDTYSEKTIYMYPETDDDDDDEQEDRVENYKDVAAVENPHGPSEEYDDITIIDIAPENRTNFFVQPELEQVEKAQMEENDTPGSSNNDGDDLIEIAYYSAQNPRIVQASNDHGNSPAQQQSVSGPSNKGRSRGVPPGFRKFS